MTLGLLGSLAAACDGKSGAAASPTTTATATAIPPSPTPEAPDLTIFRGFVYPIVGACLPTSDTLMPNAIRAYRNGIHEGVDFYHYDNCTDIELGTPEVAAKDGVVIRADHTYHPLSLAELDEADKRISEGHQNDPDILDLFRGRQVWIDHGKGIVTRYAHTSGIPDNIQVGTHVTQGEVVAFVGDSGTPESLSAPNTELHLHWELRDGDSYLGQGLPADEVRDIYTKLFEPLTPQ